MSLVLLRKFIKEQIVVAGGGFAKNVETYEDAVNSMDSDLGYDVDISPNVNGKYSLIVYYEKKKLIPISMFDDYNEAELYASQIVEKHKSKKQNSK